MMAARRGESVTVHRTTSDPREEPGALAAHAGICAGGGEQSPSLPGPLIAVIELSRESWLVAGIIPGVERQPLKKLEPDENDLLKLLERWREEAEKAGHKINRIAVAFEAGRDGFWLARWLRARGIEGRPAVPMGGGQSQISSERDPEGTRAM